MDLLFWKSVNRSFNETHLIQQLLSITYGIRYNVLIGKVPARKRENFLNLLLMNDKDPGGDHISSVLVCLLSVQEVLSIFI